MLGNDAEPMDLWDQCGPMGYVPEGRNASYIKCLAFGGKECNHEVDNARGEYKWQTPSLHRDLPYIVLQDMDPSAQRYTRGALMVQLSSIKLSQQKNFWSW